MKFYKVMVILFVVVVTYANVTSIMSGKEKLHIQTADMKFSTSVKSYCLRDRNRETAVSRSRKRVTIRRQDGYLSITDPSTILSSYLFFSKSSDTIDADFRKWFQSTPLLFIQFQNVFFSTILSTILHCVATCCQTNEYSIYE